MRRGDCAGVTSTALGGCRVRRRGWALVPVLALAVLPKCPLCLAAYLSLLGIGAGVAGAIAAAARPSLIALAAFAIAWLAFAWRRTGRQA